MTRASYGMPRTAVAGLAGIIEYAEMIFFQNGRATSMPDQEDG